MAKTLEEYLALPWTRHFIPQDETTVFAQIVELPGCMTEGDDYEDAAAMLQDALEGWLEAALESGYPIQEPEREGNNHG